jgi:hypothetical protein
VQLPAQPLWWPGSDLEWYVYWALTIPLKKKEGVDFTYQAGRFGGRSELGGIALDFLMIDGSGIGIDVFGEHWHYGKAEQLADAVMRRERCRAAGIELIFIDGEDVKRSPLYYTKEALNGVDHSTAGRS